LPFTGTELQLPLGSNVVTTSISVAGLSMTYRAPVRQPGVAGALRGLVRRQVRAIEAVKDVSFEVASGEIVAFIGPNGAGKTTTLKMLSGVLHPTGGAATVLGSTPWQRDPTFLKQIALIRGSRPVEPVGELTVMDTLRFQRLIYDVPQDAFRRNVEQLSGLLGLGPVLERQLRALSLGERMRVGLANALVYRPRVLFLDEPTIGLDVSATAVVRRFIADYCAATDATVVLTSHAMGDVESLCRRVVLIDQGEVRYDGPLADLATRLAPWKVIRVATNPGQSADWSRYGEVVGTDGDHVELRVERQAAPTVTAQLLSDLEVVDLSVEDPPLESVIDLMYRESQQ
jgi:ABC-type uncharacterized transport system ATPase subunit